MLILTDAILNAWLLLVAEHLWYFHFHLSKSSQYFFQHKDTSLQVNIDLVILQILKNYITVK